MVIFFIIILLSVAVFRGVLGWKGYSGGWRQGLALGLRQVYIVVPLAIMDTFVTYPPRWLGEGIVVAAGCWHYCITSLTKNYQKHTNLRIALETIYLVLLWSSMVIVTLCSLAIVGIVMWVALLFFTQVAPLEFLFGTFWDPQVSSSGVCHGFGAAPLLMGTLFIAVIAILLAFPISVLIALYLSEYTSPKRHRRIKPILEFLSGIPTLVYGLIGALGVGPGLAWLGDYWGLSTSAESALAAGLVMGAMLVPFMVSVMDDIFRAVPPLFRESALALGATSLEYVRGIVLPGSFPGLVATLLLAISRAMGETMIVVMVAGTGGFFSLNPLKPATTLTVHMVALLTGENGLDHPRTQAAFALGFVLFIITLSMNIFALRTVRRYQRHARALEL